MGKYDKFKDFLPTYKEGLQNLKKEFGELEGDALLEKYQELKARKKALETTLKEADQEFTAITEVVVEKMEEGNLTQIKHSKLGTFSTRTNVYVSQKDKEKLFEWLRKNQYGDLIKEQVNAKVLGGLFAEILKDSSLPENAGVEVFLKSAITNTTIK